jgi:alkylated DNA repair dioxygenase AlkB
VFVLFHGDVTEMFGDCQLRFQHTVKTAEGKNEMAPRASLVFKKTLTEEQQR